MQVFTLVRDVFSRKTSVDWMLLIPAILIAFAGLVTMNAFMGDNLFFEKQVISLSVALLAFFLATRVDTDMLKRTNVLVIFFIIISALLLVLFGIGHVAKGAQSWFKGGSFAFQSADAINLPLVLILRR